MATKKQPIIAFGAHPDDIEIGMGGTIKRLADQGHRVITCIATLPNTCSKRKKEAQNAALLLGADKVLFLDLPGASFGFNRKTVGVIDKLLEQHSPSSVFTHWNGDSHQDHLHVTNCVLAGARHNHFNVYMYEQTIPGGITHLHFKPQLYIDVSDHIEHKINSILAHKSQVKKYGDGWIEGVRGRAMHRGYQIKVPFAEAFEVIKIKEDTGLFSL
jgi:N-acetylglucosamine malate deacetylase 1